ncbi:hypothetical protein POM88_031163 [Heracleum sosnowskyi]|uniref:Uncharacterized protein n=1 Tax=Heracleum sosnowskyi TaxID=360622 RepID=A0AAD8MGD8_9APIA|nr:hypothetical protein POM88_031163 [Heracleum sosnowskyi]
MLSANMDAERVPKSKQIDHYSQQKPQSTTHRQPVLSRQFFPINKNSLPTHNIHVRLLTYEKHSVYTHLFIHKSISPSPQDTVKASQSPQATAISKITSISPSPQDTVTKTSQSPQATATTKITTCRHLHLFEILISRKANYKQSTSLNKAMAVSITPYRKDAQL